MTLHLGLWDPCKAGVTPKAVCFLTAHLNFCMFYIQQDESLILLLGQSRRHFHPSQQEAEVWT